MKCVGATTVATTMICAAMAGIQFLLQEVLKGAEHISADLEELSKQMSLLSVQVPNQF